MNQKWDVLSEKFLEKLPAIVSQEHLEKVLNSFCIRKPSTFRVNKLKINPNELEQKLKNLGIEAEKIHWYKDAFVLKNIPQKILTETDLYKQGYLYIQSLSSMIPPLILDPKSGEKILDICAAPGSKTTQMAMLMQNNGEIIANDKSHIRNYKLQANLNQQGATIVAITHMPGEILWKKFPEYFDKTLVDVPCSMEGRFYIENEKSYKSWSPNKVRILAGTQKFLLRSAISSTKPGGIIVYSTCTLSPEENEEIIDWVLKKEGNAIRLDEIILEGNFLSSGLSGYKQKIFSQELKKTKRILPSATMEGFFIAKIKKITSTI